MIMRDSIDVNPTLAGRRFLVGWASWKCLASALMDVRPIRQGIVCDVSNRSLPVLNP
jgi:hypothetical protein